MFKQLLSEKHEKWTKFKSESTDRMAELGEVFSGTKPLTRVEKNGKLIISVNYFIGKKSIKTILQIEYIFLKKPHQDLFTYNYCKIVLSFREFTSLV